MSILGSSPLGLVGDTKNGYSVGSYVPMTVDGVTGYKSLFQNTVFDPYFGKVNSIEGKNIGETLKEHVHNNIAYDTNVASLVDYTKKYPAMALLPSDFAYCKNIGVFPNNRLMVARRFATPIGDDLTKFVEGDNVIPLSTLVSWVPDGEDFISIDFGENWKPVDTASFTKILNDIGDDTTLGKMGDRLESAINITPLPGIMEGLQYQVMRKMGISAGQIPGGNPNLIREAQQRTVIKDGESGSGLKGTFKVKMVVEYEQKYYPGVDSTLVYYDIIANALAFGTSDSYFQFNGKFNDGTNNFIQDLQKGNIRGVIEALKSFTSAVVDGLRSVFGDFITKATESYDRAIESQRAEEAGGGPNVLQKMEENKNAAMDAMSASFQKISADTIGSLVGKYKTRIVGIIHAMTGANSTPWHLTIGNPKKPIFSSGDMVTTNVNLTLGPILSFNDLPSNIRIEFTLESARNLGAQEIFNKFNNGSGRSYKRMNISMYESTKYVMTKDDEGNSKLEERDIDNIKYYHRYNNYPEVEQIGNKADDDKKKEDGVTQMLEDTNPNINTLGVATSTDDSSIDVDSNNNLNREDVEEEDFYFKYRAKAANRIDLIEGTADTEEDANRMIDGYGINDIIIFREIIKITRPKNGAN